MEAQFGKIKPEVDDFVEFREALLKYNLTEVEKSHITKEWIVLRRYQENCFSTRKPDDSFKTPVAEHFIDTALRILKQRIERQVFSDKVCAALNTTFEILNEGVALTQNEANKHAEKKLVFEVTTSHPERLYYLTYTKGKTCDEEDMAFFIHTTENITPHPSLSVSSYFAFSSHHYSDNFYNGNNGYESYLNQGQNEVILAAIKQGKIKLITNEWRPQAYSFYGLDIGLLSEFESRFLPNSGHCLFYTRQHIGNILRGAFNIDHRFLNMTHTLKFTGIFQEKPITILYSNNSFSIENFNIYDYKGYCDNQEYIDKVCDYIKEGTMKMEFSNAKEINEEINEEVKESFKTKIKKFLKV